VLAQFPIAPRAYGDKMGVAGVVLARGREMVNTLTLADVLVSLGGLAIAVGLSWWGFWRNAA
jgi:hypothetical protein